MRKRLTILFSSLNIFLLAFGLSRMDTEIEAPPEPVRVLCYHDITPNPSFKYSRGMEQLDSDFQLLKDKGFEVVSLETMIQAKLHGTPLPWNWVALTFDDATKGQYTFARRLLKRYNFSATFFIPTALVEKGKAVIKDYSGIMTWKEIRDLADDGFQIASHGHTHRDLSRMSPARLREEIHKSLTLLKVKSGVETADFCLPFGLYKLEQETHFVKMGLRSLALTTSDHGPGNPALMKIQRFEVLVDTDEKEILDVIGENK